MPKIKASGGRTFSKTCLIRGREAEGRKAILASGRDNTRVAPIGGDGLTTDGSEKVPTADVLDIQAAPESAPAADAPIPGVMGDRGTVTIPSEFRRLLRLQAGTPVLIQVKGGAIVIQPAEIKPRGTGPAADLDSLLAQVAPENLHPETSTGDASGREVW